jgi:hypothetical protein
VDPNRLAVYEEAFVALDWAVESRRVRHLRVNAAFVALCFAIFAGVWLGHRSSHRSPEESASDTPVGSRDNLPRRP